MNPLRSSSRFAILLLIALAACAPGPVPPGQPDGQPATPSLIPIDLAGPEMKLGASWLYANGSLLVPVPAGIFTMGYGGKLDYLQHQVNLPEYWIFRTKVTNAQYAYCVAIGACTPPFARDNPGFDDYLHANDPVVGVDYGQAGDYCEFVHARLPTEAEWEKAARGPDAAIYPWGNGAPSCDLLNFDVCVGGTTPVNQYAAGQSYYHAFDMEGNAFEWAADWYGEDYYLSSPPDNPQGPEKGRSRVVRSSGFNSGGNQTQTFNRFFSGPADHRANLGFRCVVEDPDYFSPFCELPPVYGTDGIGGAASGPQSTLDCPVISIEQSPYCQGANPKTIVTFKRSWVGPLYSMIYMIPGSCHELGDLQYDCSEVSPGLGSGFDQLVFCSYCNVTLASPPQCPWGYTYDDSANACLSDSASSGGGACLPGFTPDATGQCCTFDPPEVTDLSTGLNVICDYLAEGSPVVICHPPFPSCPAGTDFAGDECITTEHRKFCITEALEFNSCTPNGGGGGGGGNTCNITDQSCANTCAPTGYIFDAAACSCNCNPG